jgi:hypothetical protein
MSNYFDPKNDRVIFISDGISDGRQFGTFYRKRNGSLKRFVSPHLPMRKKKCDAQIDLDKYAVIKKLIAC